MFNNKKENGLLVVGLDNAGKTSILYKIQLGEVIHTIPVIGLTIESIEHKNLNIYSWDVGGSDRIRPLWRHFYQMVTAMIFVVDSSDRDRIETAMEELHRLLREDELKDKPVLVFANKQDLPCALSMEELTEGLELHKLTNRKFLLQPCCATTRDGIYEGFEWISKAIKK